MKKWIIRVMVFFTLVGLVGCGPSTGPIEEFDSITVQIEDHHGVLLVSKEMDLEKTKTLVELLMEDADIQLKIEVSTWGAYIVEAAGVNANDFEMMFWNIVVNDIPAEVGISELEIKDQDVLKLVLTSWDVEEPVLFTVEVVDLEGVTILTKQIAFEEEVSLSALLMQDEEVGLKTELSTWGDYITEVAGLNSEDFLYVYWAIYVNDDFSVVGIGELELTEGDVLRLVLTSWYTPVDEVVVEVEATTLRVEEETQLTYVVLPAYATIQEAIFVSSDESILTVDISGNVIALKRGIATVTVVVAEVEVVIDFEIKNKRLEDLTDDELDQLSDEELDEIYEEAYQEQLARTEALQREFVETLDAYFPEEITENIPLPQVTNIPNVFIFWTSSQPGTIDVRGNVGRKSYDQEVILTATIRNSYQTLTIMYEKTVLVKGFEMKPLASNNLTFAYLMNATFQGIKQEDLQKIDVINYAFASINVASHTINLSSLTNLTQIMQVRQAGVRVVLCIGGWGADGFSQAVATQATRAVFINSIIQAIITYDFDGIDMDWEYPGRTTGGIVADPVNDRRNFSLLLKELREAMDEVNPNLLLTAAVPGGSTSLYEVPELNKYLDFLHLMTYDLRRSGWTSHHTALHPSPNTIASVSQAVTQYQNAGFDPAKIVVGAAFYAYRNTVSPSATNGINLSVITENKISYTTVYQQYLYNPSFTLYYDDAAMAYWLFDGETFLSFDHPNSLKFKVDYVVDQKLAGIMFWDYNNDQTGTLLDAIDKAFQART
jgi:chitinase